MNSNKNGANDWRDSESESLLSLSGLGYQDGTVTFTPGPSPAPSHGQPLESLPVCQWPQADSGATLPGPGGRDSESDSESKPGVGLPEPESTASGTVALPVPLAVTGTTSGSVQRHGITTGGTLAAVCC